MTAADWNSLEIAKLLVSLFVPIAVVFLGVVVARTTKRIESAQWMNQKLVEKRISFVDAVVPGLNDLYCYYRWVGNWKELSPLDVLQRKRHLDRLFHINRPFLAPACMQSYDAFSKALFRTYSAPGKDALLRTAVSSRDGDRSAAYTGTWDGNWNGMFAGPSDHTRRSDIGTRYDDLIRHLAAEVGVETKDSPRSQSTTGTASSPPTARPHPQASTGLRMPPSTQQEAKPTSTLAVISEFQAPIDSSFNCEFVMLRISNEFGHLDKTIKVNLASAIGFRQSTTVQSSCPVTTPRSSTSSPTRSAQGKTAAPTSSGDTATGATLRDSGRTGLRG